MAGKKCAAIAVFHQCYFPRTPKDGKKISRNQCHNGLDAFIMAKHGFHEDSYEEMKSILVNQESIW